MADERYERELRRLAASAPAGESAPGTKPASFVATCRGDAEDVLARAKEVLRLVAVQALGDWPSEEKWRGILPGWFVDHFAPPMSEQELAVWVARWSAMSPRKQEKAARERPWSLVDWLHWVEPANRNWWWRGGAARDSRTLIVEIDLEGWPASGAPLRRLLQAAGARKVRPA